MLSILLSDEAYCYLSEYVNSQNNRYWSAENPMLNHKCHYVALNLVFVI